MLPVAEALFPGDIEVVALEEGVTMVVVVVVTSPTRQEISFLPISCVAILIIWCLSAIRDLIQISWEKKEAQMLQTHMV
jgi:hypothetical protein